MGGAIPTKLTHTLISMLVVFSTLLTSHQSQAQTLDDPAFAAAMGHIEKGEWRQAEGVLLYMLSVNDKLHRARLELAIVYTQVNETEKALLHFDTLLNEDNIPKNVKQNILQLRSQIDIPQERHTQDNSSPRLSSNDAAIETQQTLSAAAQQRSHRVNGHVQASIGYDDNVRFTSGDYFLEEDPYIEGVFIILPDGMEVYVSNDGYVYDIYGNQLFENDGFINLGNSDSSNAFTEFDLGVEHQYQFGQFGNIHWHNSFSVQAKENEHHAEYNRLQIKLATSLDWRFHEQFSAAITLRHRLVKRSGNMQIRATSIEPNITYYSTFGSWDLGFKWADKVYEDSVFIDGDLYTFYSGFDTQLRSVTGKWSKLFWDESLLVLAKIEFSDSNASDGFDYKGIKATAGIAYDINESWNVLLSIIESEQDYSEITEGKLKDKSTTFRSKLNYTFNDHIDVFFSSERAMRSSDVYGGIDSDKSLLQLGIKLNY